MAYSKHLSDSWGIVDHEYSDPDADDDMYDQDSEDSIPEQPRQRISSRRLSSTPQRQFKHSPRAVRSYKSNRSTPSRHSSKMVEVPELVMPTPERTPISVKRQSKRRASTQQPTPIREKIRSPKRQRVQQPPAQSWLNLAFATLFRITMNMLDIGGIVLSILKYPLAIMFAAIAVRAMIEAAIPSFSIPSFLPGLAIIPSSCSIPIVNNFIPGCANSSYTEPPKPSTLQEFRAVHDSFEKVLDTVLDNTIHSNVLGFGKVMIDELRDLVKFQSSLPSKAELINEITSFSSQSSEVSKELARFNAHINQAVDSVISLNRRTLISLDELKSRSKVTDLAASLAPWFFSQDSAPVTASDVVTQYLKHATEVEDKIDALIVEARVLYLHLQNMEDALEMIRETANHDKASFIDKQEVLFAKLWTKLGGNARDRNNIRKNIQISKVLSDSSKGAWMLVDNVIKELLMVKHDIQDLRSRIAGPRNRAVMSTREIEEHIAYVQDAQDRLMDGRTKSKNELARQNEENRAAAARAFENSYGSYVDGQQKQKQLPET